MREFRPVPDPSGALQPPDRWPPTAVGTATPDPEPRPFSRVRRRSLLHRLVEGALGVSVSLMDRGMQLFTTGAGRRGSPHG